MEFREYPKHVNGKVVHDSIEEAAELGKMAPVAAFVTQSTGNIEKSPDAPNVPALSLDEIQARRGPGRPPAKK